MYPLYDSTTPCKQFCHDSVDSILSPKNYDETLKQLTNGFGGTTAPTKPQKNTLERKD
jgi:acetylxylan esterase